LGFGALWITGASPFQAWARARQARGDGYLSALQADPRAILPSARRVVALAYPYADAPEPGFPAARVSPYYIASHSAFRAAPILADWLRERGWQAVANPPLPIKAAALRAGAGRYGRCGLLITERYGGNTALALLLTDAELPLSAQTGPEPEDLLTPECEACSACVRACPVGALDGTSAVDVSRCLRAHMFNEKVVPEEYRATMGNRLVGCDDCRLACPHTARARQNLPSAKTLPLTLDALLGSGAPCAEARQAMEHALGANYARPNRVLAQAALLAANSGDARRLPALLSLCESENDALREHARWAVNVLQNGGEG